MQVIFSRNAASALATIVNALKRGPVTTESGQPHHMLPFPVSIVLGAPTERTIPWPWWHRNPFASFLGALELVSSAAGAFSHLTEIDALQTTEFNTSPGDTADQSVAFRKSPTGLFDMTVTERSRTDIGSVFGVSMVRFTMLQEYLAAHLGMTPGCYTHIIGDLIAQDQVLPNGAAPRCAYEEGVIKPYNLITGDHRLFVRDAAMLRMEGPVMGIADQFVRQVAAPIYNGFSILHNGEDVSKFGRALEAVGKCRASDWRYVCEAFVRKSSQDYLMKLVPPAKELAN